MFRSNLRRFRLSISVLLALFVLLAGVAAAAHVHPSLEEHHHAHHLDSHQEAPESSAEDCSQFHVNSAAHPCAHQADSLSHIPSRHKDLPYRAWLGSSVRVVANGARAPPKAG